MLYYTVRDAYQNALDNGYDLDATPALAVAYDMVMHCEDLENEDIDVITALVIQYRKNNP